ncbi:InlB B-repeat-containing protein [Candidatus Saccharibacteria bacterium]|nr:InlB B-repeat-containing protein [Candidatus Saccharibacteria bacterium]
MGGLKKTVAKLILVFMTLIGGSLVFGAPVFGVTDASISISVSSLPTMMLSPDTFGTAAQTVSITTDNYTGYNLTLTTSGSSTNMVNTADSSLTIPTITLPQGSSSITAASFDNEYGFSTDATNYYPVPNPSGNGVSLKTTSSSGTSSTTLTFGAEVDSSIQSGTYQNTFVITALVNNPQYSVTYNANTNDTVNNMPSNVSTTTSATGTITLSNNTPTRTNYTFLGWDTDSTATTPIYATGNTNTITLEPTQANSITLYAIWEQSGGSSNPSVSGGSGTSSDPYIDTDMTYDSSTIVAEDGYYSFPNVAGMPEVVVEDGKITSFEYTNTGSGVQVVSGTGVDTGVLALDGDGFVIDLVATYDVTKNGVNSGKFVLAALEPTATGATTYKGFAFSVTKSNARIGLYGSSSSSISTGSNQATWGSRLQQSSNLTTGAVSHTLHVEYTPGSSSSTFGTLTWTIDGTTYTTSNTSSIPSSLANATITVGTLGVEHTCDMSSMIITSFSVTKTTSQ